ncbi:MAG: glycoside hydrolase family 3 protein [Spirochaetales bacterium]|jgi:beta-N-acetylhexosaminidase|nr:glycoside hydrolase family 3 protein [Spirochaetales bacterium]
MRLNILFFLFFLSFHSALLTAQPLPADEPPLFWKEGPPEAVADELLAAMSDEEILAQVFLVGYETERPTPLIMSWLKKRNIGGIKIFGWNAENLNTLAGSAAAMQKAAFSTPHGIPLFVATDQEGGWVRHIRGATSVTPGNLAIGASGRPYDAYMSGFYIGKEIRALGINMNFAPAVDVYTNPLAHVIGPRAFSSDPALTASLSVAFYKGLRKAGIISTAKHYPGHGGAEGDSHGRLPEITDSLDVLWNRDLLPYRLLISEGIPAILSGHLSFPAVTGDNRPASLSPFFAKTLLRERLGFKGVLMTDDLYMSGARWGNLSFSEICVEALAAGNDMIMLSQTPGLGESIWKAVESRYRGDEAFRAHIRQAVRRILLIKLEYLKPAGAGIPQELFTPNSKDIAAIPSRNSRDFFFDQAARSITVIKNDEGVLPYVPAAGERVLLAGQHRAFLSYGRQRYPEAAEFFFSYEPFYSSTEADRAAFRRAARGYDTIIFCMSNPNSLEVLQTIKGFKGKVIVFSILTPVYLAELSWVNASIAAYSWSADSFKAGFAVLRGDYTAEGVLPIELSPQDQKE